MTNYADRLMLPAVISRIKGDRNTPNDIIVDEQSVVAAVFETKTDDVWYVEARDVDNDDDDHGYRAIVLRPNFTTKPSQNPADHARGKFQTENFQSCQTFVFDLLTDEVEDRTSLQALRRHLPGLFKYGTQQTLRDKRRVHNDRELLRVYDEFF